MLIHTRSFTPIIKRSVAVLGVICLVGVPGLLQDLHAQEALPLPLPVIEGEVRSCPTLSEQSFEIEIDGLSNVRQNVEQRYTLRTNIPVTRIEGVEQEVRTGDELITIYKTTAFRHQFDRLGTYQIKSFVTTINGCRYYQQLQIEVFANSIVYIGTGSEEFELVKDSSDETSVYFEEVLIEGSVLQQDDAVQQILVERIGTLESADSLLIESELLGTVLGSIPQVESATGSTIPLGNVYVLTSIDQSLFRRLLGTYGTTIGLTTVRVVDPSSLGSFLNAVLLGEDPTERGLVQTYSVDTTRQSPRLVMSRLVDYLLSQGVPLSFVIILLLIPIIALSISVYKQVLGFATYGTYTTIFSGLIVEALGRQTALTFLVVGGLAVVVMNILTKKVYLLSNAKIGATITIYSILLLLALSVQSTTGVSLIALDQLGSFSLLFPVLYILIVANSLFGPKRSLGSLGWYVKFLQFAIVVATVYYIINWSVLQNFVLGYPEVSIACLILVLFVGRYTGLQVTEYFRFAPLIGYVIRNEEEEEE